MASPSWPIGNRRYSVTLLRRCLLIWRRTRLYGDLEGSQNPCPRSPSHFKDASVMLARSKNRRTLGLFESSDKRFSHSLCQRSSYVSVALSVWQLETLQDGCRQQPEIAAVLLHTASLSSCRLHRLIDRQNAASSLFGNVMYGTAPHT